MGKAVTGIFLLLNFVLIMSLAYRYTNFRTAEGDYLAREKLWREATRTKSGQAPRWDFSAFGAWLKNLDLKIKNSGMELEKVQYNHDPGKVTVELPFIGGYEPLFKLIGFLEDSGGLEFRRLFVREEKSKLKGRLWFTIPEF